MLATITWSSATGGSWHDASNWDLNRAPGAGDNVVIPSLVGEQEVTYDLGITEVLSLESSETLRLQGGELSVNGTLESTGGIALLGATLRNAAITPNTALNVQNASRLDNTTINGNVLIGDASNNTSLWVDNGLTLNGTMQIGTAATTVSVVRFRGDQTLDGTGSVVFGPGTSNNSLLLASGQTTLTIGSDITVTGDTGNIGYNPAVGGPNDVRVINEGTIDAGSTGSLIAIRGAGYGDAEGFSSSGPLHVAAGATISLEATVRNGAAPLMLRGEGRVGMNHNIRDTTIEIAPGVDFDPSLGVLDNVTVNGDFTIRQANNNTSLWIDNGLTLNGTMQIGTAATTVSVVRFRGDQTLGGTGSVVFGPGNSNNSLLLASGQTTLTIGPDITVTGDTGNIGYNPAVGGPNDVRVINEGTIDAGSTGSLIAIRGAGYGDAEGFSSSGPLHVAAGATISLEASVRNGAAPLMLRGEGRVGMNHNIRDTTIEIAPGVDFDPSLGVLDNVTVNGDFTVRQANNNTSLWIDNGLTLNGTMQIGTAATTVSVVRFRGDQTLGGTGSVVFGPGSSNNSLLLASGQSTLTIGPDITVTGDTGNIGYNPAVGGPNDVRVINEGTIDAGSTGSLIAIRGAGYGDAEGFSSSGPLHVAAGATISLEASVRNGTAPLMLRGEGRVGMNHNIRDTTIEIAPGVDFDPSLGVLDNVTVNGDFTIRQANNNTSLWIDNGLTLNGTMQIGTAATTVSVVRFRGDQTLGGTGSVVFGPGSSNNSLLLASSQTTLTIGPDITVTGDTGNIGYNPAVGGPNDVDVVNLGTIGSNNSDLRFGGRLTNFGTVELGQGQAEFAGSTTDSREFLKVGSHAQLRMNGSMLGSTTAGAEFVIEGQIEFAGGTEQEPRQVEVMSLDRGVEGLDSDGNFFIDAISLASGASVQLVDFAGNSVGEASEVLYVGSLFVPTGATLDLNGLTVYSRLSRIDGTLFGGAITPIPDSGPLDYSSPTPGTISAAGETDEWTFYSRAGRSLGVLINPTSSGSNSTLPPTLERVEFQLIDPNGQVVFTSDNAVGGGILFENELPLDVEGTYRLQVRAAQGFTNSTGNYSVTIHDVTPDVDSIALGSKVTGELEHSFSIDRWTFSANKAQQIQFDLLSSNTDALFRLDGPNGFEGFVNLASDSELVTLPSNGTYTITATGHEGSTGQYSFRLLETAVTDLIVGTPLQSTHFGSNSAQLYRVAIDESNPMIVRLNDFADSNRNSLYVRRGLPPTRANFDFESQTLASADQQILIPNASHGEWYILVYGDFVPSESTYSIEAISSAMFVTEVSPDNFNANSVVDITVEGAGFLASSTIELVQSEQVVATASNVQIDSYSQLTGSFDLTGIPEATYDVRVTLPDGTTDTLAGAFDVIPAGEAILETRLVMPSFVGRNNVQTLHVEYANTGTVAMPAPLLRLQSADPDYSDLPLLTLDQSLVTQGFWSEGLPRGFAHSVQILGSGQSPGLLLPGERVSIPVYYIGLLQPWDTSDRSVEMEIRIFDDASAEPIPWDSLNEELRPATISKPAWDVIFGNLQINVGATWGDFVEMLSDNAKYLSRLGRDIRDVADLWNFELQQAIGFGPIRTLASSVDASVITPGADLSFGRSWSLDIDQRFSQGAFGRGWSVPWQSSLAVDANGSVTINGSSGSRRLFIRDIRNPSNATLTSRYSYFPLPGDTGRLVNLGGGVYQVHEQDGSSTRFNADGSFDFTEDVNGNRVTAGYDAQGRLETLTHGSGASISIGYNTAGLIETLTDSATRVTRFSYDPTNEYLKTVIADDGIVTTYEYDTGAGSPSQNALSAITTGDVTQVFHYDTQGRLEATATLLTPTEETARIDYGYDTAGRVSISDAGGGTTNLFYDDRGLLTKVSDPFGNVTTTEYDANFLISKITDPKGFEQSFTWGEGGALTSTTDQLGHTTTFVHEYVGPNNTVQRMTSFTDANGNTTRYTYDVNGNLTSTIYADNSVERTTEYYPTGDPKTYFNRRGQRMSYEYNAAGQVTKQTFDDGSIIDFLYDTRGNLEQILEPGNRITVFAYEPGTDRLGRVTYPEGRFLAFTYDPSSGRREAMTDQTGYVTRYIYDNIGRLRQLTEVDFSVIFEQAYDTAGRIRLTRHSNGTSTQYNYDAAGRIGDILHYGRDAEFSHGLTYRYDSRGYARSLETQYGNWSYSFGAAGQLGTATFEASLNSPVASLALAISYDAVGNRTQLMRNGQPTRYVSNVLNQYVAVGEDLFEYDNDGNVAAIDSGTERMTFSYTEDNQVESINDGNRITWFRYDALNNLVETEIDGEAMGYVNDPIRFGSAAASFNSEDSLIQRFFTTFATIGVSSSAGEFTFAEFDAAGRLSGVTDDTGMHEPIILDPFGGNLQQKEGFSFDGFGAHWNAGDLTVRGFRVYDADTGRFLQPDPIRLSGGDPNIYRYVGNNPVQYADPAGLSLVDFIENINKRGAAIEAAGRAIRDDDTSAAAAAVACGAEANEALSRSAGGAALDVAGLATNLYGGMRQLGGSKKGDAARGGHKIVDSATGLVSDGLEAVERGRNGCNDHGAPPSDTPSRGGGQANSAAVQPRDPNELLGPQGFGDRSYTAGQSSLPYRINFENYGPGSVESDGAPAPSSRWATAPAQRVDISNPLPTQLNLDTFALTGFGFGDFNIAISPSAQYHSQVLSMTYLGETFDVLFEAGLDRSTGTLSIAFQSIDPNTELPPDVLVGFLPPEDGSGQGQGFVTYTARPQSNLPTGTEIRNIAVISFDRQQPGIATDQVDPLDPSQGIDLNKQALVTIDADAPTSSVNSLPETSHSTFTVSWDGDDQGAGIVGYDIYVSIDDAAPELWLADQTSTQAEYIGEEGKTYSFYSIATDGVGYVELPPPNPDSTTQVPFEFPWQNPTNSNDTNDDGFVSPIDAFIIINELNTAGGGQLPLPDSMESPPPYLDVNGDGFLSPIDALVVINFLNQLGNGEGESDQSTAHFDLLYSDLSWLEELKLKWPLVHS